MRWLKGAGSAFIAAALAFLAFMAAAKARNEKDVADKWKQKAKDSESADIKNSTDTAKAALKQAKLHEANAKKAKADGKAKLDKIKDSDMAAIVSSWRVRNTNT